MVLTMKLSRCQRNLCVYDMIYKYKKTTHLYQAKACKYVQDDKEGIDDLMITFDTIKF